MTRFLLRRLAIIPVALALVHLLSFSYAHIARPIRAARTPYLREQAAVAPLWQSYQQYLQQVISGDLGQMPGAKGDLATAISQATQASLGLLGIALAASILSGLSLGFMAVRSQPPGTRRWLTPLTTLGLATPSFYLGSLFILGIVYYILWKGPQAGSFFPIKGFGWDVHLILPALTLMARPTVQIAQITAEMLSSELGKQYVIAARSFGHTWHDIRFKQALRNVLAPIFLTIASAFRLLVGELIVVEWLFSWSGLGKLLASTLVPGTLSTNLGATSLFLNPPVIAAVVTIIAALFILADLIASILARLCDPRLRYGEESSEHAVAAA